MTDQQGLFEFADLPDWEQAAAEDILVAEVVFNLPLEKPYTYSIPDGLRDILKAGMRVKTSLGRGNRRVIGYCVNVRQAESAVRKLKPIEEVLDAEPLLDAVMLKLTRWIAERYLCGWGQVLESVIPAGCPSQKRHAACPVTPVIKGSRDDHRPWQTSRQTTGGG